MKTIIQTLILLVLAGQAAAQTHLLIASGLGGEPRYVNEFLTWGGALAQVAGTKYGIPKENLVFLAENPTRSNLTSGESTKARIEQALRDFALRSGPNGKVMIVLIGHGASDSRGNRINLPGPDLTAEEMKVMLELFPTQPVVVVVATSASGDWQEVLAAPNRTIVTATRSGGERNESIFGRFFVDAFVSEGGDPDKDGRVTIKEAFDYAVRETTRSYATAGTLQLEHARLEGNLAQASSFYLGAPRNAAPSDASPQVRALLAERERLEESVELLRSRSGQMSSAEYQAELERLLLELARTNRSIQQAQGGGG